jgi:hypothetical protein
MRNLVAAEEDAALSNPEEAGKLLPQGIPAGANQTDLAAWTSIARMLLNTDEFITRE